jgi:O-antigen/teichoic acid export membrane protein
MKATAVTCNLLVCAVTAMVVATEGMPADAVSAIFTLLALAVPALNLAMLIAGKARRLGRPSPAAWAAAVLNAALLALTARAIVRQFPPPEGPGVWAYAVFMVAAPILTAILVLRAPKPPQTAPPETAPAEAAPAEG